MNTKHAKKTNDNTDRLITNKQACARLGGIHLATFYRLIAAGELPPPIRIGKRTSRWWASEIDAYLHRRSQAEKRGVLPASWLKLAHRR